MIHNRKFRAYFITLIFILSLLSVVFVNSEKVKAQDSFLNSSGTKLYFVNDTIVKTDLLSDLIDIFSDLNISAESTDIETFFSFVEVFEELIETGFRYKPEMSLDSPTGDDELSFPPRILGHGEFKDTLHWVFLWFINEIPNIVLEYGDIDLTEFGLESEEDLDLDAMIDIISELIDQDISQDLNLPNPLKITEKYKITETEVLNGEFDFNIYHSNYVFSRLASKVDEMIPMMPEGFDDKIKVSVSRDGEELASKKDIITYDPLNEVNSQNILAMPNESFVVEEGDILEFTIELIPGESKPIDFLLEQLDMNTTIFSDLVEIIIQLADSIADALMSVPSLESIGSSIKNFTESLSLEGGNSDFFYDLLHDLSVASFIYGSSEYPSHVTLPSDVSGTDTVEYFLHEGNKLQTSNNFNGEQEKIDLSEGDGSWTTVKDLERSKIIKKAQANVYINYYDIQLLKREKINLFAELYDVRGNNEELIRTSEEYELGFGSTILKSNRIVFDFGEINEEIEYDHNLRLKIKAEINEGMLGFTRDLKLLYNSEKSPSSLTLEYANTDNIKINRIQIGDGKNYRAEDFPNIYPMAAGENEFFILNVSSDFAEELEITTSKESSNWEIELIDDSYDIAKDGYVLIPFYVNHTFENLEAYENDDSIYVELEVGGKTGLDKLGFLAEVSYEGVDYDVLISDLSTRFVETGKTNSLSFSLENNNNGLKIDDYELSVKFAKGDWKASLSDETFKGIEAKEERDFNIKVNVPDDTNLEKNVLMITVTSKESGESFVFNVTTKVKNPSIFEMIYNVFQDAAESMGLDSILGDFAGGFLLFIVIFIVLIFVIAALVIIKREYMEVICVDRVREISTDEAAEYTITVHNPSNRTMNYQINVERKTDSEGWMIALDKDSVMVEPKGFKSVNLTVEPSDLVEADDWVEVKVTVRAIEKQKIEELSIITTISDQKPELRISGMFHWPRAFREGDKVTTSFKLENKGGVAAKNVNVVLKVNGKVKNKVENIDIPRGGFAEIEIPWIAEKGKNEVDIEVNQ